jgi:ABC-2 type transport system ATP-binding protein
MDEADKLCDRIAIVDHGELVALDSPLQLKASIPGKSVVEVALDPVPDDWVTRLATLPHVSAPADQGGDAISRDGSVFRIASSNGPATTLALMQLAAASGVTVRALSVQSATLDDVFVHYTGHALRDALQAASALDSPFMMRRN